VGVDDGVRPFVLFFCLSWFQKKEKKQKPRPVYDDEVDDDDEEENALDPVAVPPLGYIKTHSFTIPSLMRCFRVQHEEIELKNLSSQSQPEAGPSRLAVGECMMFSQ
jgi:hypothetical protein